ncbi:DUF6499 domain-containing protein [Stappia sp. MMSF_3263]|uniref:transcriptional regulator domain-containing protein n=1 Tax=Stappia sp. MMSF_3263 TaxID=3046693 RepID=UPI00273DDCD1|nr:DUF6499 domain-containing protein [Stappia sp. MMSF_3263]
MKEADRNASFWNWHQHGHYRCLHNHDRADWAWEFLRRHPEFPGFLGASATRQLLRRTPPVNLVTLKEELVHTQRWGVRFC